MMKKMFFMGLVLTVGCGGQETATSTSTGTTTSTTTSSAPACELDVTPSSPTGLPTMTYPDSEVGKVVAQLGFGDLHGKPGMPHMLHGVLLIPATGALGMFDISDPASPKALNSIMGTTVEQSTLAFTPSYDRPYMFAAGLDGAVVWDI